MINIRPGSHLLELTYKTHFAFGRRSRIYFSILHCGYGIMKAFKP